MAKWLSVLLLLALALAAPALEAVKVEERSAEQIKLNNGLVEVTVAPAFGMRITSVTDLRTGVPYFSTQSTGDVRPWNLGGVEIAYPYPDHGMRLFQPAGYRLVRGADGSATVAMHMVFTQHQAREEGERYGRYSDLALAAWVTLAPDTTRVALTVRLENPNPLPRGDRVWDTALYHGLPITRIIMPARYAVSPGAEQLVPLDGQPLPVDRAAVLNALDAAWPFVSVYDAAGDLNRIRIHDPATAPGMRVYTNLGGRCEISGGPNLLFEDPGHALEPYAGVQFTHRWYLAQGIGPVAYADDHIALGYQDGVFRLTSPDVGGQAVVTDFAGHVLARGPVGPGVVLRGESAGDLAITVDGRQAFRGTLPLTYPDTSARYAELRRACDPAANPAFCERSSVMADLGAPTSRDYLACAGPMLAGKADPDAARALSLANTALRFRDYATALKLAALAPGPDADYLKGLIALERSEKVTWGEAGVRASYLRALDAIRRQEPGEAIILLRQYVAAYPQALRPRLALAYLTTDIAAARALANDYPASTEAQFVLKLLGQPEETRKLLRENPNADLHLRRFEGELLRGEYRPLPRYRRSG